MAIPSETWESWVSAREQTPEPRSTLKHAGREDAQHLYLGGLLWDAPQLLCRVVMGDVSSEPTVIPKSTGEIAPAWLGMGEFGCCFSGIPASITLSGDTLKKKKEKGLQTTQFLHLHKIM